ncbi:DUF3160 domain-containing protein [Microvenator marinus]|uniref:DUF3160 domain-containing protein n=1 Tax=Microvenator marinus TaxID=2600177 RepID=A0A5B8XR38_9DELT|nr:DUF3160 domain-containing protein [Microvenator marinus]QED28070.1 DUF3160 domain-containing protein [Microvenator marinus]
MWRIQILAFSTILALGGCKSEQQVVDSVAPTGGATVELTEGQNPAIDATGRFMAFERAADESRAVFVRDLQTGEERQLVAQSGEQSDPTFAPNGVVFVGKVGSKSALWFSDLEGKTLEKITELEGEILSPSVSSVGFEYFLLSEDGCGPPWGQPQNHYYKIAFTKAVGGKNEVWTTSLKSDADRGERTEAAPHDTHSYRVSPDGKDCHSPSFSGDGLSLAMVCDGQVVDAKAIWDQTFEDAAKIVSTSVPKECSGMNEEFDEEACKALLPKRYTRFEGESQGAALDPSYSANHTLMVASKEGVPVFKPRNSKEWKPLANLKANQLVWAPDGQRIYFDDGQKIYEVATEFYLQDVKNLHLFPELWEESEKLAQNRFVVRESQAKEFYAHYEKLRYERRPQFVTADAVLQVYRDEFLRIIEEAEVQNGERLRMLSQALWQHYLESFKRTKNPSEKYLAVYFATAWVPLGAVDSVVNARQELENPWDRHPPVAGALAGEIPKALSSLPAELKAEVESNITKIMAHEGLGELKVPGMAEPVALDWSQFKIRGNYAENDLGGYFLAMTWFAQAPLPFDASLVGLLDVMEKTAIGSDNALKTWSDVNATIAAFMGKPVDATVSHAVEGRRNHRDAFEPFDAAKVKEILSALRGPVLIRDPSGADERAIKVVFLPKRVGLDTTFFRRLLHPDVPMRPFPSGLDVMSVLGSSTAYELGAAAQSEEWRAAWVKQMDGLREVTPGPADAYWSTDIYHAWLAVLGVLADASAVDGLPYTKTNAWRERSVFSALGGYVQLKHSAVLYAGQDYSAECGGDVTLLAYMEQPILPTPRGSVDPNPAFFRAIEALTARVYKDLWKRDEPNFDPYAEEILNSRALASRLAEIAEKEVQGSALSEEDLQFIEFFGAKLEQITLMMIGEFTPGPATVLGEQRAENGVALVTDIHTNITRNEALQIGIGPLMDMWVAVPDGVASTMTQGAIFSYYEFQQPISERLTDAEWHKLLKSEKKPELPAWTSSFVD